MFDSTIVTAIFSVLTFLCTAYVIKIMTQQINSQKDSISTLKTVADSYKDLIDVLHKNKETYIENAKNEAKAAAFDELMSDTGELKELIRRTIQDSNTQTS